MARQQSNIENIDLAGSLAATLTPRVPHAGANAPRSRQNSGLFDMGALYAETFGDVIQRVQPEPRLAPLSRAAEPAWPLAARWPQPVLSFDLDEVPIEFAHSSAAPRSRGVGWFGVVVAWLATVTMASMIAIGLPAHAPTHWRAPAALAMPAALLTATPPQAATPPPVTEVPPPVALAAAIAAPAAVRSPPPVAAVPLPAPAVVLAKKAAPKAAVSAVTHSRPAPASAVTATAAAPVTAAAPAIAATSHAPPSPKPAAAPASTAGMSLDELIRHEVQKESAKHR